METATDRFYPQPKTDTMKLLLHCCCGPCTTVVAEHFLRSGATVTGWYYNPNLGPAGEWSRRREAFARVAQEMGLETRAVGEEATFSAFLLALARGRGSRCERCYQMRLEAAARGRGGGGV